MRLILPTLSLALKGGPSMFKNSVLACKEVSGHLVGITRSVESLKRWPFAWYSRECLWRIHVWYIFWNCFFWQGKSINWHLCGAAVMITDWSSQQKGHWPAYSGKWLCEKSPIPNISSAALKQGIPFSDFIRCASSTRCYPFPISSNVGVVVCAGGES